MLSDSNVNIFKLSCAILYQICNLESFQTADVTFTVTHGHWNQCPLSYAFQQCKNFENQL